jgi:murein DD-endopeptidase MepM/ murein hydrolase activator NlpD
MSTRDRFPPAKLPRSHYFLTVSRGERVRALAIRPALVWAAFAAIPMLGLWACGATAFIAFHDTIVATVVTRENEIETDYQTKLADARAELDRLSSRRLIDQDAFEGKMRDLLSRQSRLEQRGAALAALATEAGADATALAQAKPKLTSHASSALSAIEAVGGTPADGDLGAARAYAPAAAAPGFVAVPRKPRPLDGGTDSLSQAEPRADHFAGELAAAASDATLDPDARIGLVGYSLDRVERAQSAVLTGVTRAARVAAQHFETVIERTGQTVATLKAPEGHEAGGVGGPFIPLEAGKETPAFEAAVSDAEREVERARRLRRLMPHLPLRYPLIGDASMSSPFGYRPDPFLGRPALHPGVDLVQSYGAEIKATAIGRVSHAGPMGGYGNAVEIDHGNGIATRYGHMSEVLVEEGQTVKPGDTIGRIGSTGRSTGPHLHYEVRIDGEPVDPERFLTAARD